MVKNMTLLRWVLELQACSTPSLHLHQCWVLMLVQQALLNHLHGPNDIVFISVRVSCKHCNRMASLSSWNVDEVSCSKVCGLSQCTIGEAKEFVLGSFHLLDFASCVAVVTFNLFSIPTGLIQRDDWLDTKISPYTVMYWLLLWDGILTVLCRLTLTSSSWAVLL